MPRVEQVPNIVGGITLVAGGALLVAPKVYAGPVGLEGHDLGIRVVGLADLVLVPGLLGGRRRWPWMAGRCGLSLAQAAYVDRVAPDAKAPRAVRASAAVLLGLAMMDGVTALQLRRAGA